VLLKRINLKNKKIAFFYPYSDFATNPVLLEIVNKLNNLGVHIDIFCNKCKRYSPLSLNYVSQYPFPYQFKLWDGGFTYTVIKTLNYLKYTYLKKNTTVPDMNYDLIFGVNSGGVIAASEFSNQKTPIIYISFEIFFWNELKHEYERTEKKKEIEATQKAELIITQDKYRMKLLQGENNFTPDKCFLLPVTPNNQKVLKTNYIRENYNIPVNKCIVIHSGSFENWTYAEELIKYIPFLQPDIILFIHTRYISGNDRYIKMIKKINSPNVILSTTPLNHVEYEKMIASADIGLCLYKPIKGEKYQQKNIEYIGLSSGKFSYYMKYGIPVISVKQKTYSMLLKQYKFGINIQSFNEISNAVNEIKSNIDVFQKQAKKIYSNCLDFDNYWVKLENKIRELVLKKRNDEYQNIY